MSRGNLQRKFARMVADLIIYAYDNGYELTLGDAYRDPRLHGEIGEKKGYGRSKSNHKLRLAIDLNLFRKDEQTGKMVYLTETEDHLFLGEYWESIGGAWGGRFNDGNHYSLEYQGQR